MLKTVLSLVAAVTLVSASALGCGGGGSSSNNNAAVTNPPALSPATGTVLTPGLVGTTYPTTQFSASNGSGSYTFNVSPNPPFPGMTITQSAVGTVTLSGVPTQQSTSATSPFSFSIQVVDSNNLQSTNTYTVVIQGLTLATAGGASSTQLPPATHAVDYSSTITATGGTGPYTFSIVPGGPSWLTIGSASGTLTGTPPASGSTSFSVYVTDSSSPQKFGQQAYALTIN